MLRDGQFVASCAVSEVDNDRLVEMMVGRRIEANFPPKPALNPAAPVVVEVEEVQLTRGGPRVVSFALRKGEILGFAGLVGSGRTETVLAIWAPAPPRAARSGWTGSRNASRGPTRGWRMASACCPKAARNRG
ncbi:hypothetical protein [Paracoccus mutanolyticus]|uniref:hypothetical protein n=1 Tax=Paracoccus mutanolyticus TaxID=1499308 RepID=UPI001CB8EECB|nr:hypothetical protein [Paracoccus mutanolyticus]